MPKNVGVNLPRQIFCSWKSKTLSTFSYFILLVLNTTTASMMYLKLLFVACFVALVSCQTPSSCAINGFNFYSSYDGNSNHLEFKWDWIGCYFSDGTNDAFDGFLYLNIYIDGTQYNLCAFSPVEWQCDIGTTDSTSASYAEYAYNLTSTVQLRRTFYAPRDGKIVEGNYKINTNLFTY